MIPFIEEEYMDHNHILTKENTFEELCQAIADLQNPTDIGHFLQDLCTPQELTALTDRWRICKLLQQGDLSYRDIHKITGASLVTIGRVARFLKHEKIYGYKKALELLKKKAKIP